ncbi:MAG: hypothetical protein M1829_000077 [Trizodia sp. TS-e1964]|nr:MAG: hypothetical protein M1829_000077 [Trizodia sp. TS-e1964]
MLLSSSLGALALLVSPLAFGLALAEPPNPEFNGRFNSIVGLPQRSHSPASAITVESHYPSFLRHVPQETAEESQKYEKNTFYQLSSMTSDFTDSETHRITQRRLLIVTRYSSLTKPPTQRPWTINGKPMVMTFVLDFDNRNSWRAYTGLVPASEQWTATAIDFEQKHGRFKDLPYLAELIINTPIKTVNEEFSTTFGWVNTAIDTLNQAGFF